MSEHAMEWACGYYDQFKQELYNGNLTVIDLKKLYKEKKITEFQFRCGTEYLKGE